MAKFVCKACGYRIESKKDSYPKKCPYCSKETIEEEENAEELVKEVEEILK